MFKKILLILFVLIIVIIAALAILIKIYVTPESVRSVLIPQAEKALNRKVELGKVNIGLVRGIQFKDFSIKEKDDKTDFIKCKDFILKFKLLPLLSRQLIIEELRLESPEIRIKRNIDGSFNYEGIGKERPPEQLREKERASGQEGLPLSLLIESVAVGNAKFSFIDEKRELPDVTGSADVDLGIRSEDGEDLSSQGSIYVKLDEIAVAKQEEKKIKDITATLRYGITINLQADSISIKEADLTIQEIPVSLKGVVTKIKTEPEIDITVNLKETKTSDIQKSLLPFAEITGLSLSGVVSADLALKGSTVKADSIKTNGKIVFDHLGVNYDGANAVIDGDLNFNEQVMDIDASIDVGKDTAALTGSIKNYFKKPDIRLDFHSEHISLANLLSAGRPKDSSASARQKTSGKITSKEAEPLDLELTASGEIRIDATDFKNMSMQDFYVQYRLNNNMLEILEMTALAGKGTINMTSFIDLAKPGYTYSLSSSLDSLHAEEFVNSLFPKAENTVFGILSLKLSLSGSGTKPDSIRNNLTGKGDFVIEEGKITDSKIPENLAHFLGIEELRTIIFREANGTIKIGSGIARLSSIFSSDDISMNPSGKIGLDETLDLKFDLRLSPRLTDKAMMQSNIASYIKDDKGWGSIPLKVSGTFANPSYRIDIEKAGKRVIKKKAKELIEDLFDKGKETDEQPGESDKPDIQKPIKELLNDILD
jgi:AsmA protein